MTHDIITLGDIASDSFIRLKDADVHCKMNKDACEICLPFGAKVPYESVTTVYAAGNSCNAAVAMARLGVNVGAITFQGDDAIGKEQIEKLKKENVGTEYVNSEKDRVSNFHYILWYHEERTILTRHEQFEYKLPDFGSPKWLYLSSFGERTEVFHDEIADYLDSHPDIKLAFQPGTFQIKLGKDALSRIYKRAEFVACNKEEAEKILGLENTDVKTLLSEINKLGPKIVLITDGPRGAFLLSSEGRYFMPPYPDPKPPFERTGAGDAYTSTFVAALSLGLSHKEALEWAPINSMSVVQEVGSQSGLLTRAKIEEYLKNKPGNYSVQNI